MNDMLTPATQIPTLLRGKVRALVKAHGSWPDFLIGTGKLSASISNAELIAFALQHRDLREKIEAVLFPAKQPAPAQVFKTKVRIKAESESVRLTREQHARLTKLLQVLEEA